MSFLEPTEKPVYRRQKGQNRPDRAFVVLDGVRHYLGAYDSPESREAYDRLVAERAATGRVTPPGPGEITITDLCAYFWKHAEVYYRHPDDTPTGELSCLNLALRRMRVLYASLRVEEFSPRCFKAIAQRMVDEGLARSYINLTLARLRSVFKWAVAEELAPVEVWHRLQAVSGLKRGRCAARETEPVKPVLRTHVEGIFPHERRQVFDLPEPSLAVTEHQAEVKSCACGHLNRGTFPPEVAAPMQYGLRVKSVAVYLKQYQLLPFDRLAEIMRDLFACDTFSEGTLANFSADCSRQLEPIDEIIRTQVAAAEVAGFDETGVRATGSLHWLHTVSTRWLTWYFVHKRRGREAMDAANVLPDFQGRAVHDFWSPYLKYDCDHAFCNAHLLRELIFLWEEQHQAWAKPMIDHLLAIKTAVDTARQAGLAALPSADLDRFLKRYLDILDAGYAQNPGCRTLRRTPTSGPVQAEQSSQPARPFPRPSRQHPCLHARFLGAVRQ